MKKRIVSFVMALVMAVSLMPTSVLAMDETETPITGSIYGDGVEVVLKKLPADATSFSVDADGYYIRTGNSNGYSMKNWCHAYYGEESLLTNASWYNSADAVAQNIMEMMNLCNGKSYSSVEEMIHQDGYDSVEAWVAYILNSDTVSVWWTENIQFYTYDGTLNNSQVATLTSDIFSKLFGNSNVNWDATVSFRLLELYNAENTPSFTEFGSTKPDKVILLQFGEPIILDKSALQAAIDGAPKEDGTYYTSGDRFNGAKYLSGSFWTEYQNVLNRAKNILQTATKQATLDAAVAALQAAMANLIPTTQVNPTTLYETLNRYTGVFYENSTSYTPDTWAAFDAARTAGHALLDGLFDENGNATAANTAEKQSEIDAAAAALTKAAENLYNNGMVTANKKTIEQINTFLPDLLALANTVKQSDYTAESWAAFAAALTAARNAKAPVLTETKADDAAVAAYKKAYEDLYQQFYYGLTPVGDITVSLTYLDPEKARQGDGAGSRAGAAQQVTLSGDYSLYAAVDSLKNKPDRIIWPYAKIFINGVYVTKCYLNQESFDWEGQGVSQKLRLHPGDTVVVDLNLDPQSELQPTYGSSSAELWQYIDSIKTSQFVQSNGLEVKAGEPFTLTVQQAKAALGRSRAVEAGANMTLFISDMAETPSDNHPTTKQLTQNEKAIITDADGSASVTLYREGWYLIAAYDLREDEKGNIDNSSDGSCPSYAGKYYSANSGTAIWVHVNTPDDLSAVKNTLQSQLDKAYAAYAENYFRPAVWSELKSAYDTGTAAIKAAATSGSASDAQQTAIETIRRLQNNTTAENKQNLTTFRTELNKLPDDASLLSAGVKSTVDKLIACYEGMSDYQRRQLTGVEQTKYNSIKAFADTHETFPADKAFKLTVNVVGDTDEVTAVLNDMTKYLREHPATQDRGSGGGYGTPIQTEPFCAFTATIPDRTEVTTAAASTKVRFVFGIDYAAYFQTRTANGTFTVDGAKWSISNKNLQFTTYGYGYTVNGGLTVTIGGEAYEIKSVTYQGIDPGSIKSGTMIAYDDTEYLGKDKYYINMRFEDAAQEFTMPYNDVAVTVTWGPVSENVNAARTAALSRLQTLYNSLGDKAKAAYDTGVESINAAASVAAVETAYQSAVVAMKKAADNYGKVQVIVENTTYSKKAGAPWDGTLVDTWVDLSADSTMMSCVAAALKTKNATVVGAESNYISSINGLGEFDGNKSAGWMGTLNDWFTNEGFGAFTVKNGKLADGDVIRIMFTSSGYGADLGGTWGNSDTTVKALTVDGAALTPNFIPGEAGGQYDYTLIIDGESASVKLTPTASNKNFQVKTFLNEKVTDRSEGSSFYKRTETIPVKAGDTIYVGCGAKNWLSMNNQAGNTQSSDGTWYALHVVSINTGASYVTDLIAKLPTSLKYETYTRSMNDVAAARAAYEVLVKDEQDKVTNLRKLVSLEKQIEGFTAVDAFKVQLAALPEAEKLSVNDREAVDAAEAAYKVLEQKDCLTVAEKEKAETVFAKMAEIKGNLVLAVEKQIDAIGEVTLENGAAVKAAQAAYDALTAEQKQLVNGEKVAALNAAVAKLAELKREKLLAEMGGIYASVGESLQAQVNKSAPIVGSIGGEWLALALARSGRSVPAGYYDNVVQYVKANVNANERLHNSKSTDNSRVILALTAIGKDPANVGGHNLLKGLDSMNYINKQGINGPVFALIALDSHNYPAFGDVTRDVLIDRILSEQVKADGGWALGGADEEASDVDVTAMTIQALAPYYKTNAKVKTAVDKGLTWLSAHQQEDGGFASWGAVNSESCAQVIVALAALGIDPLTDSRFIKNGITALDALCGYYTQDDTLGKGFAHVKQSSGGYVGGAYNQMATEQAYYALNAYYRFANRQNRLYDMTDVCITHNFGAWTVTKAATCTESGISTRQCSVCGTEETMIVPSLGHSMTATAGKAATCTEAGHSAYWSCSRCGKFFSDAAGKTEIAKDSWVIAALGHDEATRAAVAATCYASGHEADTYCKRCGMVINAGANIPATGKHTYVNGVCTVCGVRNPAEGIKGDDLKVDSKDNTIVTGGGLTIKTDEPVTDEKLAEIKAAVENGSIVITVNNTPILQLTKEDKESDGGKNALMQAGAAASGELKKELDKLAEKLDALRGDSSKKNARLEKIIDVTVELVKTNAGGSVESVAQLTELPRSVTVTVSITNELYDSLKDKRVCVVRSHTDASGNVTTTELPAYLGGTEGNRVLSFQTDKASTFAIVSYETVSTGGGSGSGSITVVKPTSANTADDSQMVIWLGSAVMAAAAVVVLTRKQKRVSK